MERSVATKKLRAMLGSSFGYRVDLRAPSAEERATAKAALPDFTAKRDALKAQKRARFEAILAADVEYQKLAADYKAASEATDKLSSLTRHYKIQVGKTSSLFFHIMAEGDSWEEVIDKLTSTKQAA